MVSLFEVNLTRSNHFRDYSLRHFPLLTGEFSALQTGPPLMDVGISNFAPIRGGRQKLFMSSNLRRRLFGVCCPTRMSLRSANRQRQTKPMCLTHFSSAYTNHLRCSPSCLCWQIRLSDVAACPSSILFVQTSSSRLIVQPHIDEYRSPLDPSFRPRQAIIGHEPTACRRCLTLNPSGRRYSAGTSHGVVIFAPSDSGVLFNGFAHHFQFLQMPGRTNRRFVCLTS